MGDKPDAKRGTSIDILVDSGDAPSLRLRVGVADANRIIELRVGSASLFIHAVQPDALAIEEAANMSLH